MNIVNPKLRLYVGIISISFFPIAFYFFSKNTHPLLAVFLLFFIVTTLSLPGALIGIARELQDQPSRSGRKELNELNKFNKLNGRGWKACLGYGRRALTPRVLAILTVIATITVSGNFLVVYSLSHGLSPSVTQAILRTETIFVSLGGIFIFKESYPRSLPWVIAFIVVGFTVMGYEILIGETWGWDNIYILHVLAAALCFGSFQIISKFIIHDLNLYFLNGVRTFMGCLLLLPWVYPYFPTLNGEMLLFALLSALAGPFLGRNIILSCTRDLPLNYIGCNLSVTPIFSLGLQWLFLHNLPSGYELAGGGIILLSVFLYNFIGKDPGSKNQKTKSTTSP